MDSTGEHKNGESVKIDSKREKKLNKRNDLRKKEDMCIERLAQ